MESAEPIQPLPGSLISILGVVYLHRKTSDGGDIYLTQHGLLVAPQLEIKNWQEKSWFNAHRQQLKGTGFVYRVPTQPVEGKSVELVYKNCRVGEHVPADTHTFLEYLNTEFNSPWEEFSLVMEMREGRYGPPQLRIRTQEPLAIYVPPGEMQLWQSGRSRDKIERIKARHPGIDLDILRQYKLLYGWIKGRDVVEVLVEIGLSGEELVRALRPLNQKATNDLERKGYVVADMKPTHIILDTPHVEAIAAMGAARGPAAQQDQIERVTELVNQGDYSVVDYELLLRSPEHEAKVKSYRRHRYLDDQRDKFVPTPLPPHLSAVEIFGVPYIHGRVESTGGKLWVVGRNANLFDYFLPERWRKTTAWKLSRENDVYYTVTKDNIHIVWKASRVGELPPCRPDDPRREKILQIGYNSPFEAFGIAQDLARNGVAVVYTRAIYETGCDKIEASADLRRYDSHWPIVDSAGQRILRINCNYVTIRGYWNGLDSWVAEQVGELCRPIDLGSALGRRLITQAEYAYLHDMIQQKLRDIGYDGALLEGNDLLIAIDPAGALLKDPEGRIDVRICNLEQIGRR